MRTFPYGAGLKKELEDALSNNVKTAVIEEIVTIDGINGTWCRLNIDGEDAYIPYQVGMKTGQAVLVSGDNFFIAKPM